MTSHDQPTGITYTAPEFTTNQTAAALRAALKATFPGIKFSVRMARGTAYGWLDVSWTDGPTETAVEEITRRFESRRFDGTDDSYRTVEPTLYADQTGGLSEPRYSCCGVAHHRDYSTPANYWAEFVAVPGSEWWRLAECGGGFDTEYRARRAALTRSDLTTIPPHRDSPDDAGDPATEAER